MPKAPAFPPATASGNTPAPTPATGDEERTAIESAWADEPSTTVEQGDVADRIRAIAAEPGRRNGGSVITATGHSVLDEPTVDDQRAHALIAALPPPGPAPAPARLVVTQGNDTGQQIEVEPGKSYTIGRAIDNDFVLTDIAVSRKHFDLRHENSGWVIVDRGSGNGTLVNGNLEDQPFVLANGDAIEIGNTAFRFEHASAPARGPRPVAGQYDIAVDEEEQSTIAGKPVPGDPVATPAHLPPPPRPRPKTAPPPAPVPATTAARARNPAQSTAPPNGALHGPRAAAPAAAGGGLPGLPPHAKPPQPGELGAGGAPSLPSQPQMLPPPPQVAPALPPPMLAPPPQSAPLPSIVGARAQAGPAPVTTRPMAQMAQPRPARPSPMMPVGAQAGVNGGGPQSAGGPMPPPPMGPASMGPMSAMGPASMGSASMGPMSSASMGPVGAPGSGPAPAMLTADAMLARPAGLPTTIPGQGPPPPPQLPYSYPSVADIQKHAQMLVVGNGVPRDATSTSLVPPTPFSMAATAPPLPAVAQPGLSRKTKLLLGGAGLTLIAAIATIAIMKGFESKGEAPAGGSASPLILDDPSVQGKAEPEKHGPTEHEATRPDPTRVAARGGTTKPEPAKPEPAKPEPAKPEPAKPEPAKPEPAKQEPAKPEPAKPEPTRGGKKPPKGGSSSRPSSSPAPRPRTQVAAASRADTSAARSRASELYRQKKFSEAAAVLTQAAASLSGADATDLKTAASVYQQLGVAYNRGMAPAAKPVDAYNDLRRAQNLDSGSAGGELTAEIRARLAQIAPKAAVSFYVRKDYSQAFQAVRTAEANGVTNADTKLVRDKLEGIAKDLYDQAAREMSGNPDSAKQKLRQIKGMVDGKSPILAKANQLLGGT